MSWLEKESFSIQIAYFQITKTQPVNDSIIPASPFKRLFLKHF